MIAFTHVVGASLSRLILTPRRRRTRPLCMWTCTGARFLIRRCTSRSATSRARPPIFPAPAEHDALVVRRRRLRERLVRAVLDGVHRRHRRDVLQERERAPVRVRREERNASSTRPGASTRSRRARGRRLGGPRPPPFRLGNATRAARRASVVCFVCCLVSIHVPCSSGACSASTRASRRCTARVPIARRARRQKTRRGRKRSYRHRRSKRARSSQPPAVSPGWPRARLPTEHRRRGAGRRVGSRPTRARPARVRSRVVAPRPRPMSPPSPRRAARPARDPAGRLGGVHARAFPDPSRVPRAPRGRRALRGGSRDWTPPQRTAHRGSEKPPRDTRTFRLPDPEAPRSFSSPRLRFRRARGAASQGAERRVSYEGTSKTHYRTEYVATCMFHSYALHSTIERRLVAFSSRAAAARARVDRAAPSTRTRRAPARTALLLAPVLARDRLFPLLARRFRQRLRPRAGLAVRRVQHAPAQLERARAPRLGSDKDTARIPRRNSFFPFRRASVSRRRSPPPHRRRRRTPWSPNRAAPGT